MEFKDRFKECREEGGWTQEELARIVGTSQTAVNKIENGVTLKPKNILDYIDLFGVRPKWLTKGDGEKYFSPDDKTINSLAEKLGEEIMNADEDVQELIQALLTRYKTNKSEGAEIAKAIKTILGMNNGSKVR